MPHRCLDVKGQKAVNFSQNCGIFTAFRVGTVDGVIFMDLENLCRANLVLNEFGDAIKQLSPARAMLPILSSTTMVDDTNKNKPCYGL
jgi:hypothetical protein